MPAMRGKQEAMGDFLSGVAFFVVWSYSDRLPSAFINCAAVGLEAEAMRA